MTVDRPWGLAVALAAALVTWGALAWWAARRTARVRALGAPEAAARLLPASARDSVRWRIARIVASVLALGIAFAGPRWGTADVVATTRGVDVVLVLDASRSMLAEDERPSRLERMRQEVRRLRAARPGDRVGLVAFAGRAYTLSPLTADAGAIELFLDNLDPTVVGQPGSALAPALRQAADLLGAAAGDGDRAVVLLTDGEAFDDPADAAAAAGALRKGDVHLIIAGFGTPGGATIPQPEGDSVGVHRDADGAVVVTRADLAALEALARAADGEVVGGAGTDRGRRLSQALDRLAAARRSAEAGRTRPTRVAWFAWPALLLLLGDVWRADGGRWRRPGRWPRRDAAAVVLLLLALRPQPLRADAVAEAQAAARAGRWQEAAAAWRKAIRAGDRRPWVLYNYGTALLKVDSVDAAVDPLERAVATGHRSLRQRATYNLGVARLRRALLLPPDERGRFLDLARAAFKQALLLDPSDQDARWNYELALRATPPSGGGATPPPAAPSGGGAGAPPPRADPGMQPWRARQLLEAAARDERDTQSRRRRPGSPGERPPGGRDW